MLGHCMRGRSADISAVCLDKGPTCVEVEQGASGIRFVTESSAIEALLQGATEDGGPAR